MQEKDGINFFWDTYAVVELESGNTKYLPYANYSVVLTIFNLVELYWVMLNQLGEEKAEELYEEYKQCVVKVDDETIKEAVKFRKKVYNTKKISYADAIGYVYAKRNKLKFLTGDKEFQELENVEFVKK
jgi:predicted nucleic acid-binding protein